MLAALSDLTLRAISRVTFFKILKCVHIEVPDPSYLELENRYQYGFLEKSLLLEYCRQEENHLAEEFLHKAFAEGDQCFAIRDRDVLASYGWYSNRPTEISDNLRLHFDNGYMYMYNGFTRPEYRGRRLHAIGMTMALKEYLGRGFKGLVSYVEANNLSSLKSVYRMGYRDCGDIYVLWIFGRYLISCSAGCKNYGMSLEAINGGWPETNRRPGSVAP